MYDIEFFEFTKEDFERIWTRRSRLPKTWNGADPKPAFNYNLKEGDENYFLQDNWNDPALADFRELLADLEIHEPKTIRTVRLERFSPSYDELRYVIESEYDVYVLSQYKSRGKIQSFVATEYGKQISIYEFTQLLIDLGLEKIE
jgi:hypothetical protein